MSRELLGNAKHAHRVGHLQLCALGDPHCRLLNPLYYYLSNPEWSIPPHNHAAISSGPSHIYNVIRVYAAFDALRVPGGRFAEYAHSRSKD